MRSRSTNDVLLGYCHNGSVAAVFFDSVLAAFAEDARRASRGKVRRLVEYTDAHGPYIQDNRARIARYFLDHTDYQWLWMVDNDIKFPPDTLYRLLRAAEQFEVSILAAAYWNMYPGTNCYLSWLAFTPKGIRAIDSLPAGDEPVEVTAAGMGCTLIHRDVLEAVRRSYPNDPWDTFGADILVQFEDGGFMAARSPEDFDQVFSDGRAVRKMERMGEDVTACLRARQAGFKTYGFPPVVVEHFKPHFMPHGQHDSVDRKLLIPN